MTETYTPRSREAILAEAVVRRTTAGDEAVWVTCWNCGGSGDFPSPVEPPGRCRFYCWTGRDAETFGRMPVSLEGYVKRIRAEEKIAWYHERGLETPAEIKRREKREAAVAEKAAAYRETRDEEFESELFTRAHHNPETSDGQETFYASLRSQLEDKGYLTESQIEAAKTAFERDDERTAARAVFDSFVTGSATIPEGRVKHEEFQVLSSQERQGYLSGQSVTKLLLRSRDGWKVWLTHPTIRLPEEEWGGRPYYWAERGDVLRLSVTISPKEDDFGFGSRPSNAEVVSQAPREEE